LVALQHYFFKGCNFMSQHFLKPLFSPTSVAVFGASERTDAVGQIVFQNMLDSGYKGKLYPINPKHEQIQGQPAYPHIKDCPEAVEMAVITTPAHTVPAIIEQCGEAGVKAAVIISAGFREVGAAGLKLEQSATSIAQHYGIRFIGPNCLGIMRPALGLNATFNKGGVKAGNLALISQSGALCTAVLDWAEANDVGFSSVVSMGISADIGFGEILDYLASDAKTDSILLYIEGIQNARSFMSALRAAARLKPVIVIKVGRHETGSKAAMSHTGSLVGGDDAFVAALERAGVVRVQTFGQVFATARTLASRYRKAYGSRLAIVTNGGGPGVMAADRAADLKVQLADLSADSLSKLNEALPPTWSHGNPIDVIGDATAERYRDAVKICLEDRHVDGVLVILTPQAMTKPTEVATEIVKLATNYNKPILTCWMGRKQVSDARKLFVEARIPDFQTPEAAVEAFAYMAMYHQNQKLLVQTPGPLCHLNEPDSEGAQLIIESVLSERRKVLSEMESKALLGAFQIPIIGTAIAKTPNEALVLAESLGFPVAMKINSPDISHKTDVGGVRLNLGTAQAVRTAFKDIIDNAKAHRPDARLDGVTVERMSKTPNGRELMIGVIRDPVFGPIITIGAGGTSVEVIGDRAVALPPLNRYLAQTLIDKTRVSKMLGEFRRMPAINRDALENVLLRVSEMICELPWLQEMDINPLIADENGAVAVDARVVVDYHVQSPDRYSHMAIYPYPSHLVSHWQLNDGSDITIRPIRPEDAKIEQDFVRNLSQEAKYFRFMQHLHELTPTMLIRFTQIDYDREMAFIAVTYQNGIETQLGVARYTINPDSHSCEFAIVIADEWQHRGFAHRLMHSLMDAARARGLNLMEGEVLTNNVNMLRLVEKLGFKSHISEEDRNITLVSKLL
jgi:acetyltransferase